MRRWFKLYLGFWWRCAKEASAGSFDKANAYAAVLGGAILWIILWFVGLGNVIAPASLSGTIGLAVAGAFVSIILAWCVIYAFRLLGAPARLYQKLQDSIPPVPESDIAITLHDGMAYEMMSVDSGRRPLPEARAWIVQVKNNGNHLLQKCQLMWDDQPVSGYFELRRDEHRDLPIVRIHERNPDPRPIVYFLDPRTWEILDGSGLLANPGTHTIKVLSADSHPGLLKVTLSTNAVVPPREWNLTTCV